MKKIIIILAMAGTFSQFESLAMMSQQLGANASTNINVVQLEQESIRQFEAIVPYSTVAQSEGSNVSNKEYWTEEKKLRLIDYVKNHILECKHTSKICWKKIVNYFPDRKYTTVKSYFWQYVYDKEPKLQQLLNRVHKKKGNASGDAKQQLDVPEQAQDGVQPDTVVEKEQEKNGFDSMVSFWGGIE